MGRLGDLEYYLKSGTTKPFHKYRWRHHCLYPIFVMKTVQRLVEDVNEKPTFLVLTCIIVTINTCMINIIVIIINNYNVIIIY